MNVKWDLKKIIAYIDWKLLIFLFLFLDVKIAVKVFAIVFIYAFQFNFKFDFKQKNSRLPLFYVFIIGIAIINWLIWQYFLIPKYNIVFLTGIAFWALCILAIHQLKLSVERSNIKILHNTLFIFFLINILASVFNLVSIIAEIDHLNPYRYQGLYQKYFISTGDYIKGITFDTSTTNAIINAIALIYFLYRKKYVMVLCSMIVLLLTASNFTNLILLVTLTAVFIFRSTKDQKSIIVICVTLLIIFLAKVSPQNDQYLTATMQKIFYHKEVSTAIPQKIIPVTEKQDSELNDDERKQKIALLYLDSLDKVEQQKEIKINLSNSLVSAAAISVENKPELPKENIHSAPYQSKKDTTPLQNQMFAFINLHKQLMHNSTNPQIKYNLPGKAIALQQTIHFFQHNPFKSLLGDGLGNFSSKLALRTTGLNIAGGYPLKYTYINKDFLSNHLDLYLYYFTKNKQVHSIINTPNSVYDQLLGEYGIAGIAIFLLFYFGYFFRQRKYLTYGIPISFIMLAAFSVDYWFEQLSVVIIFELIMLINIKENSSAKV